ncbi:amidohydrolase [Nocardioides antri]|uniref:Amidohydrolase n=1 Tax=Nocardioides antri TaxID=2607659 RepID=A0A5B1M462_9ACTN|nr:amidohydrolase [Nocardioides antri]KAA1427218.1 amidohydrolase [Nocardioides antri]
MSPTSLTSPTGSADEYPRVIDHVVEKHHDDLIDLRRDLHRHPELSWEERRTTDRVVEILEHLGWRVTASQRSGALAEIGEGDRVVALRADLDALPVQDLTQDPWTSMVPGVAHACGHDVHTSALIGAAHALAEVHARGLLPGRVRLLFQPAEEVMPGGAVHLINHGAIEDVERMYALHAEPAVDVGTIGVRTGPITSAADRIEVRLEGNGGHTSRPHLTGDLTFALAKLAGELPAVLSRRMDPRSGVSVVWGVLRAGSAPNVIPDQGIAAGTVRILDSVAWAGVEAVVREAVLDIVRPYGVTAMVDYLQGVPPVVNDPVSAALVASAVDAVLGPHHRTDVPQSLGGEDFGWYLSSVPGAMFRLGTRTPGGATYDLHQGDLRIDEQSIGVGARVLAAVAVRTLSTAATRSDSTR